MTPLESVLNSQNDHKWKTSTPTFVTGYLKVRQH